MKIESVLGNNVVSSRDEDGNEIIVTGRGIGFKAKKGNEIDPSKITKVFASTEKENYHFIELVKKMPEEQINCASDIISYAELALHSKLSDFIYITLTDHLNYAIERARQGLNFKNELLWEIERYYNTEYQIGLEALDIIEERLGVRLSKDEAGFIALHIINSELELDMTQSMTMPRIIQNIVNIVKYHFNIELKEDSLEYERFLTHLKFFLQRAIKGETYMTEDKEFCELIIKKYPEAYECVEKIEEFMQNKMDYAMSLEEKMYLTVHIQRIAK